MTKIIYRGYREIIAVNKAKKQTLLMIKHYNDITHAYDCGLYVTGLRGGIKACIDSLMREHEVMRYVRDRMKHETGWVSEKAESYDFHKLRLIP